MSIRHEWMRRLRYLGRRSQLDQDLEAEIQFHIDTRAAELEASGLPRNDARAQARREFGPVARMREDTHAAWQFRWLEDLAADLRYAFRAFRRSPGFTLTAVLSLALGIGANSAVYTALDAVLWKPLPVADPQSLVRLAATRTQGDELDELPADFAKQLRRSELFSDFVALSSDGLSFSYDGRAERIVGEVVSPNFFGFLGLRPVLGEGFTAGVRGGRWAPEAVLSYRFWKRRFAGDPGIVGRVIHLNTYPFTVVGVSPPSFFSVEQGFEPELRLPILVDGQLPQMEIVSTAYWKIMARRKPGMHAAQAEAAADAQFQEFLHSIADPEIRRLGYRHLRVLSGARGWPGQLAEFHAPLFVLLGLVAVVLLIACANGANMLLARATVRRRELAVRASIGAGRQRLIRQMLAESTLLSLLGGALAMAVTVWAARILLRFLPQGHIALVLDLQPDAQTVVFTSALALLTGLLFGLAPALHVTRGDLAATLKSDSAAAVGETGGLRLRQVLVAGQVAFSVVLLIAAALFVRTLATLRPGDYHVRPERVLLFTLKPQQEIYSPDRIRNLTVELIRRVSETPGVRRASIAEYGPLASRREIELVHALGGDPIRIASDMVTPGFFDTIGVPLLAGRDFTTADTPGSELVAIVNESLARTLFGDANAIGRTILRRDQKPHRIVGVVADIHYHDLHTAPPPTAFFNYQQEPPYMPTLHVRADTSDTAGLTAAIRREFDKLDKGFPVFNIKTLELRIEDALARERMVADLSAAFGGLALALAAVGLYGVLAYSVSRRTREIGIRMALGSSAGSVLWLIAQEALLLVLAGSVAGAVIAGVAARLLASYLFGVGLPDPVTLLASVVAMLLIAALAVAIPVARACRVDPLAALRHE
ncbi:MAG: ABC transporter permease [Bryobacteraceae bacterium]|jgi:predicted permease